MSVRPLLITNPTRKMKIPDWQYTKEKLLRHVRFYVDLPAKKDPEEFGGGRVAGVYLEDEIHLFMCSYKGCGIEAYASWGSCSDGNLLRPLCAVHDIEANMIAALHTGDPEIIEKCVWYSEYVQSRIDYRLPDRIVVELNGHEFAIERERVSR